MRESGAGAHVGAHWLVLGSSLLAWSAHSLDERIELAPAEGTVLLGVFDTSLELRLEEFGQGLRENEIQTYPGSIEYEEQRRTALKDGYVEMSPAGLLELRRTFEELRSREELSCPGGVCSAMGPGERESESRLEGETVVFTWSEARQTYDVEVTSGAWIDPDQLDALCPDTALEGFLPPGSVEPGDSWLVDARCLAPLFAPGGTAGAVESNRPVDVPGFFAALEGDLEVRFVRKERRDGAELAVLEISRRVEAEHDAEEQGTIDYVFFAAPGTLQCKNELIVDVAGTLLWNLSERHPHGLVLEADLELEHLVQGMPEDPEMPQLWTRERWTGRFAVDVRVTRD
jgi:hypothetical protein